MMSAKKQEQTPAQQQKVEEKLKAASREADERTDLRNTPQGIRQGAIQKRQSKQMHLQDGKG